MVKMMLPAIALILLALVAVLMTVPWRFQAQGQFNQKLAGRIRLRWLMIFFIDISVANSAPHLAIGAGPWQYRRPISLDRKRNSQKTPAGNKRSSGVNRTIAAINTERMRTVWSYLPRFSRALRLQASVSGTYGTGDPAETGTIYGMLTALRIPNLDLDLNPDFMDMTLAIDGQLSGRIIPGQIIGLAAQFLLTRNIVELWRPKWRPRLKIRRTKAYV